MSKSAEEILKKMRSFFSAKEPVDPGGKSILIVGGEIKERTFMNRVFKKRDYRVFNTEDENEGLQIARKDKPGLIVLSSHRLEPRIFDLSIKIKKDNATSRIPILAIADAQGSSNIVEYVQNTDAYIFKPVNEKELIRQVETLLIKRFPRSVVAGW